MLITTLRLLHIIFMAAWFGSGLFSSGDARRTLSSDNSDLDLLVNRLNRYGVVGGAAGLLTIVTGFGLIFALGGFAVVSPAIHISIVTSFIMWVVGLVLVGGSSRKIAAGVKENKPRQELLGHAKKIAMGTGILHLLWLITLVLMVFRAHLF